MRGLLGGFQHGSEDLRKGERRSGCRWRRMWMGLRSGCRWRGWRCWLRIGSGDETAQMMIEERMMTMMTAKILSVAQLPPTLSESTSGTFKADRAYSICSEVLTP